MKCTRIGEKRFNWSCFEIDLEMNAILLMIGIAYGVNNFKWWNKSKYCTLNSLSYHFSPFDNENYHRFVIALHANNLTSLSPYATDLTSDQVKTNEIDLEMNAILLMIGIAYGVWRIVIKSVQQCTYFLFSVHFITFIGYRNTLY
jgi:hypothetical protein